jgi:peptidoglycan-N-acetylglucosamine deacetylase
MDSDSETNLFVSTILKTPIICLFFTACNSGTNENSVPVNNIQHTLPDSSISKKIASSTVKKRKTIYLTFDDGPNKGTNNLLHIIEEEQIPVTLFVVGQHVNGSKAQMVDFDAARQNKLFEIANHSYTHANNKFAKFYAYPSNVVNDFARCQDSLQLTNKIVRTPGRNIWRTKNINFTDMTSTITCADSVYQSGFTEVGWDMEWHYDNQLRLQKSGEDMANYVDSVFAKDGTRTTDHLVFLAHDQTFIDAKDSTSLHQFIQKLKATQAYDFEVISKYPNLKN